MRLLFLFLLLPLLLQAQSNTEIYVFDLKNSGEKFSISKPINVTRQNHGYDNQPHFLTDGSLYFVKTKEGQTEVVQWDFKEGVGKELTHTPGGSEYSPTPIPGSTDFSAIRLDTTGLQLLYRYSGRIDPKVILENVVVGYHEWLDSTRLLTFVLGEPSTLQLCDVKSQNCKVVDTNIGRSIHKIPGAGNNLMSYISKKGEAWEIRSFDPSTGETKKIIETLPNSEDLTWSPDGTIFMGRGNKLYTFKPGRDKKWKQIADLSDFGLQEISRLAVAPRGDRIAIVVNQ